MLSLKTFVKVKKIKRNHTKQKCCKKKNYTNIYNCIKDNLTK